MCLKNFNRIPIFLHKITQFEKFIISKNDENSKPNHSVNFDRIFLKFFFFEYIYHRQVKLTSS